LGIQNLGKSLIPEKLSHAGAESGPDYIAFIELKANQELKYR